MVPDNQARVYDFKIELPQDIDCEQCILQWTYVAGNNWGCESNGECCSGCGPQEWFRACSDIKITSRYFNFYRFKDSVQYGISYLFIFQKYAFV